MRRRLKIRPRLGGDFSVGLVATYEYDPWGKLLGIKDADGSAITSSSHAAIKNPLRYRGYYYDIDSGFYYLQSRYYDPQIGRFINGDNQISSNDIHSTNLFTYCGNNPVNRADGSGHFWLSTLLKSVAPIVIVAAVVTRIVCTIKEVKRVKRELASLPAPSEDITTSFRNTLKDNAKQVKETTKEEGIVKSGLQFYNNVRNMGKWDLKQQKEYQGAFQFNDHVIEGQDIGNINFGYTGKALGLPTSVLLLGAGVAQMIAGTSNFSSFMASNGDDLRDQMYIMYGIMLYEEDQK